MPSTVYRRLLAVFAALASFVYAAPPPTKAGLPTPETVAHLLSEISDITGMKLKRPVPMSAFSKEEWRTWVEERIKESAKPEEIAVEERAMKIFGFVPDDFDLRAATVDLLSEQAAAVYDHKQKRMIFVVGNAPGEAQDSVLVHELSHALADQHFDMSRFLDKGPRSDESESARLAVVEGQAMWIMVEAALRQMPGQSLTKNGALLDTMLPTMEKMAESQYPVFSKSPLYLRRSMLFPYSAGLRFQQAVVNKLGQAAFAAVLRDPPSTTQQVLHPELYFDRPKPPRLDLPHEASLANVKPATTGDLGEFDFHVLFEQYASKADADAVAPAWRAGRFALYQDKNRWTLEWAAAWANEADAQRAFALCAKAVEGKSRGLQWSKREPALLEGRNQFGGFTLRVDANRVVAIEGLP